MYQFRPFARSFLPNVPFGPRVVYAARTVARIALIIHGANGLMIRIVRRRTKLIIFRAREPAATRSPLCDGQRARSFRFPNKISPSRGHVSRPWTLARERSPRVWVAKKPNGRVVHRSLFRRDASRVIYGPAFIVITTSPTVGACFFFFIIDCRAAGSGRG